MTDLNLLKTTIEEKGLRNKFIAEKLGLSPEGYYKKLRGSSEFKVSEAQTIADVLGLSADERNAIFFASGVECEATNEVL